MRLNGEWVLRRDGTRLPVMHGGLVAPDGGTASFPFLLDTGADATVLTYEAVVHLGIEVEFADEGPALEGIGGSTRSVALPATIWLLNAARELVSLRGRVSGRPFPAGDDLCVLGRDFLNNFAVIVDFQSDAVALLAGGHRYVIQES